MRLPPANRLNRALWVLTASTVLSWVAGGVVYAIGLANKPVDPSVVWSIGAVFVISLTGATATGIITERRVGGRSLRGIEQLEVSLALTTRQARRMSRQFARAGVLISPSRLRAISAGAEASDAELVDIEFALIATEPEHNSLLHSRSDRSV
jgi:hypothetical protein